MNKIAKSLFLMGSAAAVTTIVVSAPSTVDAEANLSSFVFETSKGVQFTVSYSDYVDAILAESGDLYELVDSDDTSLVALGVNGSAYVDYNKFISAYLNTDSSASVLLDEIYSDSSYKVDEDTVASYETIEGFNDDGTPIFGEAEVPEVISID